MAVNFKANTFNEEVLSSEKPVLVDFWATWCGPCRAVSPLIEQLAEEFEGKALVGKVNVDEEPTLAAQFGVVSIPTVFVFKDGNVVERLVGARSYDEYAEVVEKYL